MTGVFWNMRGFNQTTKYAAVRDWINQNDLKFGGLLETRFKEKKAEDIVGMVFQDWSFMSNYEFYSLGRIWILWSSSVRVFRCLRVTS